MGKFLKDPINIPCRQVGMSLVDPTPEALDRHVDSDSVTHFSDERLTENLAALKAQLVAIHQKDRDEQTAEREQDRAIGERLAADVAPALEALTPFAGSDSEAVQDALRILEKAHSGAQRLLARADAPLRPRHVGNSLELAIQGLEAELKKRNATKAARMAELQGLMKDLGVSL